MVSFSHGDRVVGIDALNPPLPMPASLGSWHPGAVARATHTSSKASRASVRDSLVGSRLSACGREEVGLWLLWVLWLCVGVRIAWIKFERTSSHER